MSWLLKSSIVFLAAGMFAVDPSRVREPLVAHEWGTFTSVASEDGSPVKWAPLSGPADLPCFVARLNPYGSSSFKGPNGLSGFVRMETPVLYFYSPRAITLSVRIAFPQGWITEWYPHASSARGGQIAWDRVEVAPGMHPEFPSSKGASHYYAARETDSAPLRVGEQWEKLIFYRGAGDFEVPVRPAITSGGRLKIRNAGTEVIPLAILFENEGGKVGYRFARGLRDVVEMDPPELTGKVEDLYQELTGHLVEFGLYRKEAAAMVETWRDSWFEEGMRVFYIVPRGRVDSVLPLDITPRPDATARVFVGRVELLSPGVRAAIEAEAKGGDGEALMKFGRFLAPFVAQMERTSGKSMQSATLLAAIGKLTQWQSGGRGCVE